MQAKTKKIIGGTVAVSLVAALAVGGTLAYLTHETQRRVNNFTFAQSDVALNAMLTEPAWDGVIDYDDDGTAIYAYTDVGSPVYGYTNGERNNPVTEKSSIVDTTTRPSTDEAGNTISYGIDEAQSMIPGSVAAKNPIITNTGNQADSWVAAKLTFVYAQDVYNAEGTKIHSAGEPLSDTDLKAVTDIITIDWNTSASADGDTAYWELIDGTYGTTTSLVYYYNTLLAMDTDESESVYGDATEPIFTTVSVNSSATNEQLDALNAIGGFDIYIEGFAAQDITGLDTNAESATYNTIVYSVFKAWGQGGGVVFTHTPTTETPANVSSTIDITE